MLQTPWSAQQIFTHSENIQDYKNSKARFKPQIKFKKKKKPKNTSTIQNEDVLVIAEKYIRRH